VAKIREKSEIYNIENRSFLTDIDGFKFPMLKMAD